MSKVLCLPMTWMRWAGTILPSLLCEYVGALDRACEPALN
jgi:hypothetical protein